MSDSSDIKTFKITGGAEIFGSKRTRKSVKNTARINQTGGNELHGVSSNITMIRGNETPSIATHSAPIQSTNIIPRIQNVAAPPKIIPAPSQPFQVTPPTQSQQTPQTPQTGGADDKVIRVELRKHATPKRVHLNPKKSEPHKIVHSKKDKTRKVRKVTVGVSSLHKRMTRAKKLSDKVKEVPLQELRDQLIKKGLIKSTSKAPEQVLRQIAADAQIVAGKAL